MGSESRGIAFRAINSDTVLTCGLSSRPLPSLPDGPRTLDVRGIAGYARWWDRWHSPAEPCVRVSAGMTLRAGGKSRPDQVPRR